MLNPTRGRAGVVTIASVSVLPLVFTSGWASGINAYAVVLVFGVLGATGVSDQVPQALQRPDVLIAAGVLFLCEAVADKVPYVDSVWDSVHTVIRPVAGAVVAALLAGESGSLPELAAGAVGGSTALISHLVKAGTRMAVNTSPEPFSNIAVSVAEDLGVAGIISFAVFNPWAAAAIAGTLLVLGIVTVLFLASRIRRFIRRRAQRREERRTGVAVGLHRPPDW
ncbi:membrane protein [Streptomyces pristinaespiralis]|uniref:Membrane protein n=1 Tax=Streptomyces pristinaespiralis TaxID=38300 RepID=A0A0M4DWE4_STRPR|nr:membrane protein [Streptomyces pristinaespiralis]